MCLGLHPYEVLSLLIIASTALTLLFYLERRNQKL
jgi:hypothetical protein